MDYKQKYLKYKMKYLDLKNQTGGDNTFIQMVKNNDIDGVTAKLAGTYGIVQKIGSIIGRGKSSANEKDSNNRQTALEIAIEKNNIKMVELLLNNGAVLSAREFGGQYGIELELAVNNKNKEIVQLVLADVKYISKRVIDLAIKEKDKEIVKLLLTNKNIFKNLSYNQGVEFFALTSDDEQKKKIFEEIDVASNELEELKKNYTAFTTKYSDFTTQTIDMRIKKLKEKEEASLQDYIYESLGRSR